MSPPKHLSLLPQGKDCTRDQNRKTSGVGGWVGNGIDECQAHVSEEIECSCGKWGLAKQGCV